MHIDMACDMVASLVLFAAAAGAGAATGPVVEQAPHGLPGVPASAVVSLSAPAATHQTGWNQPYDEVGRRTPRRRQAGAPPAAAPSSTTQPPTTATAGPTPPPVRPAVLTDRDTLLSLARHWGSGEGLGFGRSRCLGWNATSTAEACRQSRSDRGCIGCDKTNTTIIGLCKGAEPDPFTSVVHHPHKFTEPNSERAPWHITPVFQFCVATGWQAIG